jgi:hypothetical protein
MKAVILLVGAAALAFLLGEPHFEGRNAHATVFEVYFKDPFLAYAYLASTPFFVALYRAYRAIGRATEEKLRALRTIRNCAFALAGFAAFSVIFMPFEDGDDRPQGIFMRLLVIAPSIAVAAGAKKLERSLQNPGRPVSATAPGP